MPYFNDNTVYELIHLFVLVMKKSFPIKKAYFKEKLPIFFNLSYQKSKQGKNSDNYTEL